MSDYLKCGAICENSDSAFDQNLIARAQQLFSIYVYGLIKVVGQLYYLWDFRIHFTNFGEIVDSCIDDKWSFWPYITFR